MPTLKIDGSEVTVEKGRTNEERRPQGVIEDRRLPTGKMPAACNAGGMPALCSSN